MTSESSGNPGASLTAGNSGGALLSGAALQSITPIVAAGWVLRVAVLVHAIGFAAGIFARKGTGIGSVALMEWGTPHATIAFWERTAALVVLGAAVLLAVRPMASAALLICGAFLVESLGALRFGGYPFVEWVMYSQALRYLLPLALFLFLLPAWIMRSERWRIEGTSWILRIALATVFIAHGLQAWHENPGFIDLLIGSTRRLIGYRLTESAAVSMLKVIAVVDIIVAVLVLVGRWRWLLAWLCFWSLITAASRMTATGWGAYTELLVRASHFMAPVAVWLLAMAPSKEVAAKDHASS